MKTKLLNHGRIFGLMTVMAFAAVSCEKSYMGENSPLLQSRASDEIVSNPQVCSEDVFDLFAGQSVDVGSVTVANDDQNIYVTFSTDAGWFLTETHLYVMDYAATSRLAPGQAPFKSGALSNASSFTFAVPFDACGGTVYIQAHAAVVKVNELGEVIGGETAYGGEISKPKKGSWFGTIDYFVECCEIVEPPVKECKGETAWAEGSRYVSQGNWATFTPYVANSTVTLFAGQFNNIGTVHFSEVLDGKVTITIEMNATGGFQDVSENVKIQDYDFAPSGNPAIGGFDHKGNASGFSFSIVVPASNYYGVHVDALVCR
jgi:hypothetical protein